MIPDGFTESAVDFAHEFARMSSVLWFGSLTGEHDEALRERDAKIASTLELADTLCGLAEQLSESDWSRFATSRVAIAELRDLQLHFTPQSVPWFAAESVHALASDIAFKLKNTTERDGPAWIVEQMSPHKDELFAWLAGLRVVASLRTEEREVLTEKTRDLEQVSDGDSSDSQRVLDQFAELAIDGSLAMTLAKIASDKSKSANSRMLEMTSLNPKLWFRNSKFWADQLGVRGQAIRKTDCWKRLRDDYLNQIRARNRQAKEIEIE